MALLREELNLGGEWLLTLDPNDCGVRERWFETFPEDHSIRVSVPAVWDLWFPDYDGVGWYCRRFTLPSGWIDQYLEIYFGAVNYYAEVWLNGRYLGSHEGGYTPFTFPLVSVAENGENILIVRVVDPKNTEGYGNFKPIELPIAKERGYWSFAGIWGEVKILRRPHQRIVDIFVCPDLRRKRIAVETSVQNFPEHASLWLKVVGTSYERESRPGLTFLDIPHFEAWCLENPALYCLEASIQVEGELVDKQVVRFGMREFTVKDNRFHLNHRPIFIKGVLLQPDYPCTLAYPENEDMARYEIESAKEAGFNLIRVHIKPAVPVFLDLADKLGMMIYEEPPIGWIKKSDHLWMRCETSVREMILRDRNHPSIVIWGMLNETGNANYVTHGGAQDIKEDLCRLARSLDPTRVIIDDSAGVNATREPSRLMRPYRDTLEMYDDLHIYQRAPSDSLIRMYFAKSGEPNQLAIISEFGFGGPEDLPSVIERYGDNPDQYKDARFLKKMVEICQLGFMERGLDKLFGDFSGFCAAARQLQCDAARIQIDAMRSNPKLAGYCYTQLADAGHEFCAGYLDRWRRPKPVMDTLKEVQQPVRPLIWLSKTNFVVRDSCEVRVLLANEPGITGMAEMALQVIGPTNQVLWKKNRSAKIPRNGQELWQGAISASSATGNHRFVVKLIQEGKVIAHAEELFHVVEPIAPIEMNVHILDPYLEYTETISKWVRPGNLLAPIHIIPPLANTIRAYPDNDLIQILAQVRGGAVAVFFGLPGDWNDLAELLHYEVYATSKDAVGGFLPVCHYVKMHPVFDKLPSRCLMRQPYCNVIPAKTFLEKGDEDICGVFDTASIASGNYMVDQSDWWGNDILVRPYGSGRIVMTHLRILEHLGEDPVAQRIFVNLLNHFGRRSVPTASPLPPEQKPVEWLRHERTTTLQRWMVLGEFPNWRQNSGFTIAYPPEKEIDFDATYEGWLQPIRWRRWFACAHTGYIVDLQKALEPIFQWYPKFDRSVAYAYTEVMSDRRVEIPVQIGYQDATRIWLNNMIIFETEEQVPHDQFRKVTAMVTLRQGKNTILVKCAKIPGPFKFSFAIDADYMKENNIKWWK